MTQAVAAQQGSRQTVDNDTIRPFPKINFPEAELTELRRRIKLESPELLIFPTSR